MTEPLLCPERAADSNLQAFPAHLAAEQDRRFDGYRDLFADRPELA